MCIRLAPVIAALRLRTTARLASAQDDHGSEPARLPDNCAVQVTSRHCAGARGADRSRSAGACAAPGVPGRDAFDPADGTDPVGSEGIEAPATRLDPHPAAAPWPGRPRQDSGRKPS
jgi:hypothetical protein